MNYTQARQGTYTTQVTSHNISHSQRCHQQSFMRIGHLLLMALAILAMSSEVPARKLAADQGKNCTTVVISPGMGPVLTLGVLAYSAIQGKVMKEEAT
uniref:Uncharacterized protein n=1 Tax=Oryza rufipogon TaxID=4529 RepID=A0A0E0P6W2_ORYRU